MTTLHQVQDEVAARGPRFAVRGTFARDRHQVQLFATADQAEDAAERMRADGMRGVQVYLPLSDVDYATVAWALADARAQLAAAKDVARAAARRLTEAGISEVETAHQLGVDRMTVRSWLGKR